MSSKKIIDLEKDAKMKRLTFLLSKAEKFSEWLGINIIILIFTESHIYTPQSSLFNSKYMKERKWQINQPELHHQLFQLLLQVQQKVPIKSLP